MASAQCPQCRRVKRVPAENPLNRKLVCKCGARFRAYRPLPKTVPVIQIAPAPVVSEPPCAIPVVT